MKALAIAATGMNAQQTNLEVIANNIANINTTGFKRARAEFSDLLYQAERVQGVPNRANQAIVPEGSHIGLGVKTSAIRNVHLQGNAEFADALGFVFRNLRWDAEEDLSRLVGDVAAHRLSGTVRAIGEAQRRMVEGAAGNLAEYFTEERPILVSRAATSGFEDELRALRDAVARTEKRIDRLASRLHGKPRA